MANWKELGEVPDSDEEDGFDTQQSELVVPDPVLPAATTDETDHDVGRIQEDDIWDVPDSQEKDRFITLPEPPLRQLATLSQPFTIDTPDSSPLSSACSDFDLPSIDPFALPESSAAEPAPPGPNYAQHESVVEDEVSRSFVESSSRPPIFTEGNEDSQLRLDLHEDTLIPPLQSQELGHDSEEQAARQTAVRYERSLRPRKPIQEHPYVLENAQYSTFLKQHGVKPLRIAAEAERRRQEQTSQDKDFEEESQESRVPEISDESQANGPRDVGDGLDIFDIPSSSPMRTSPMNLQTGPSSQVSTGDTDGTSITGEDLPALEDLLKQKSRSATKSATKRKSSPSRSSTRKRRRYDVIDSDPFEPAARLRLLPGLLDTPAAQRNSRRSPEPFNLSIDDATPYPPASPIPILEEEVSPQPMTHPDGPEPLFFDSDLDEAAPPPQEPDPGLDGDDAASSSDSESGSELVQQVGRRIRGVLPASWLRLDQQAARAKAQTESRSKQLERPVEQKQRRGLAQRRFATAHPSSTAPLFLDDDSDLEEVEPPQLTTDEVFHNQTRLVIQEDSRIPPSLDDLFSDDGASVVEDDSFDPMLPGRKRQIKLSESFSGVSKRLKMSSTQPSAQNSRRNRQPRITSLFDGPTSTTPSSRNLVKKKYRQPQPQKRNTGGKVHRPRKARTPPQLSILDVVEPDAPQFLKIAARAAARRTDQGRSSPRKKMIKLATREDHVDAVSVLNNWRTGSIRQRQTVSAAKKDKQAKPRKATKPLTERSRNIGATQTHPSSSAPALRKFTKRISDGGRVSYQSDVRSTGSSSKQQSSLRRQLSRSYSGAARPAQLETNDRDRPTIQTFNATKRRLDNIYRKQRGDLSASSLLDLASNDPVARYSDSPPPEENPVPLRILPGQQDEGKSRYKKRTRPRRVDVEAPQYSRANDPIPFQASLTPEPAQVNTEGEKLQGLGPYGTQYTHHFETFPLDSRVYFHESTLLGSGLLEKLASIDSYKPLSELRPRVAFTLGDQTLRWGPWDAQVSSELGVVFDTVAEQLERTFPNEDSFDAGSSLHAIKFVMKYMIDALSLTDDAAAKVFVSKALGVIRSFDGRVKPLLSRGDCCQGARLRLIASIYNHLLIAALLILRLCQSNNSLMTEQFQMEELIKDLAKTLISSLLQVGLDEVRKTYDNLQTTRFRERGIRDDTPVIQSWVIAMKVLENAQILRGSFWDITYAVMATPKAVTSLHVRELEQLWKNIFTLLPLTEFNDKGIVISGKRHDAVVDGWSLPQKLLKRVFQVYQENSRQSPSFNNYCRALVGRCHYLVQSWGWRRCVAVVGVIFDFFGSQNLAHLRNEEVYKSPNFLEHLSTSPSLSVEPEDKCFHIFLKLIALSIKKLREIGSSKDIRNLIARTMPNHNRQLLKEQTIQERDLAALRNHHDLLCTLFWASPPDLRPGAHLIERLVSPVDSHKEACLINLRAWSQLAKFLIGTGEVAVYRPFTQWMNTFFQQMMQQFEAVEKDMQLQFLALSKDASNSISPETFDAMVASNKAAVMDVIHFSVRTSLDVMRQAPNLGAASFALNRIQLPQMFKHFSVYGPQKDWAVLQALVATLDTFLTRIDEFMDEQESQQSESQLLDSAQGDDAIMLLDNEISKGYFSMARNILASGVGEKTQTLAAIEKANCVEQVVLLGARLGARSMNGGLLRLCAMFKSGKYALFEGSPASLSLDHRKYLVLFITTLLQHGFDDFSDAGFTLSEIWMLSLVKPRRYLAYENRLAEQLRKHQKEFVPEAVMGLAINPGYFTNRDMFEFAISWMRKSLRDAGPSLKRIYASEFKKALEAVMQQIKGDLRAVAQDSSEHPPYVAFIREIISLIKTHGSEICRVDDYYYQINKEYSPSTQDPQLQLAGMMSYGLRLSEGDARVIHPLFFLLLNNFKMALMNSKLDDEVKMLRKGLENPGIRGFILGKMLPAIIQATKTESSAYPLVDIYVEALYMFLAEPVVPSELTEEDLADLLMTVKAVMGNLVQWSQHRDVIYTEQIHLFNQMLTIINLAWPSLHVISTSQPSSSTWNDMVLLLKYLRKCLAQPGMIVTDEDATSLLTILQDIPDQTLQLDPHVLGFSKNITDDLKKNWLFTCSKITIQAPGKARGVPSTQGGGHGSERPCLGRRHMGLEWDSIVVEWNSWYERVFESDAELGQKHYASVLF